MSVLAFLVVTAMPADPVRIAIYAWNLPLNDDTVAALRSQWNLDRPLIDQYIRWLGGFVRGEWGTSFRTGYPVFAEFAARLPLTLAIGIGGLAIGVVVAIPLGFAAALRPGGFADGVSRVLSVGMQSVPVFCLGLALIWLLGVELRWIQPFAADAEALVLPVGLIAFRALATLSRVYRAELLEAGSQPFFRAALAKGVGRREALWRHGHRHALYALVAAVRAEAGWAIGGTATIEILFGLPGISQFLVQSIAARDYFVLQAYIMVGAIWMTAMNAAVGVLTAHLDPRIR